jgi:hypothetical protein
MYYLSSYLIDADHRMKHTLVATTLRRLKRYGGSTNYT